MGLKYYTIQVNSVYLTHDGTSTGVDIKSVVDPISVLQSNYTKILLSDFRGNSITQKTEVGVKSRILTISAEIYIPKAVGDSLISLHQTAEASDIPLRLKGTKTNSLPFDLSVLPAIDPFTWESTDRLGNYNLAKLNYVVIDQYVGP